MVSLPEVQLAPETPTTQKPEEAQGYSNRNPVESPPQAAQGSLEVHQSNRILHATNCLELWVH